jgi:hypothetical protein
MNFSKFNFRIKVAHIHTTILEFTIFYSKTPIEVEVYILKFYPFDIWFLMNCLFYE